MALIKDILVQRWKSFNESWRFAITAFLIVRIFFAVWSWLILSVQPLAVQNIEISNEPVLTIFNLTNNKAYTYLREIDGQVLTFQLADGSTVRDLQTGSTWDISTGTALQGAEKGVTLSFSKTPAAAIFPHLNLKTDYKGWFSIWQRFDANWYTTIAATGYGSIKGDDHFPPLFPVLIRTLTPLFGSAFLAGLLISQAATLFAVKLLYDLF